MVINSIIFELFSILFRWVINCGWIIFEKQLSSWYESFKNILLVLAQSNLLIGLCFLCSGVARFTSTLSLSRSVARSAQSSVTRTQCRRLSCSWRCDETREARGLHSFHSSSRTSPREALSWSVPASRWRRRSCTVPSWRSKWSASRGSRESRLKQRCIALWSYWLLTNSWFAFIVLWAYGVVIHTSFAIFF